MCSYESKCFNRIKYILVKSRKATIRSRNIWCLWFQRPKKSFSDPKRIKAFLFGINCQFYYISFGSVRAKMGYSKTYFHILFSRYILFIIIKQSNTTSSYHFIERLAMILGRQDLPFLW